MSMTISRLKFSESGVRGVVGEGLSPHLVAALGAAFGRYVNGGKVVVGSDTRPSGALFVAAVSAGLTAVGCEVIRLGVAPTPTVQLMAEYLGAAGVVVTASHNPMQWNALKFIARGSGRFLNAPEAAELFDIYTQGELGYVPESECFETQDFPDAFAVHRQRILQCGLNLEGIRRRHFRVAVDCCNGVGGKFTPDFLRFLGCEVFAIHTQSGCFERPPEPLPEHLSALCQCVRDNGCAIGFAQDPDGDRLTLVDENAVALSPQLTVALAVDHVLAGEPSAVAVNVQTTRTVGKIADLYGCEVYRSTVGEINVVEEMLEHGAAIGGEGNCGGVIYGKVHYGRDSFVGMALLLEMLSESEETLSQIVATLPKTTIVNVRYDSEPVDSQRVLESLDEHYRGRYRISRLGGVGVSFPEGEVLVRMSNTENILRLSVEGDTPEAAEKLRARVDREIRKRLRSQA
ncbi:MAG: hypothetical protein PHS41_08220 [Victivallaceae bacterium]|nr:hypothetical protein [Victivallaceae bacterium]